MGGCKIACAKSLIVTINTLVLLAALAITCTAIYLHTEQYRHDLFGEEAWIAWVPLAFGVVISIVALIGCCTTLNDNKCCIGFYGLLQLVFGAVVLAAGAFLIVYIGYMLTISQTEAIALPAGLGSSQRYLSDYTTGLYQAACGGVLPGIAQCETNGAPSYCFWDQNAYATGLGVPQEGIETIRDTLNLCPVTTDAAGLKLFQNNCWVYLNDYFKPSAIAFIVFGSIMLLAFIGSCYLACCASEEEPEKPKPRTQTGGQTAGTQADRAGAPLTMA